MADFKEVIELTGKAIDAVGVFAIVAGLVIASWHYLRRDRHASDGYHRYRQDLGRGILLGLELLVAADIIRTVAVAPTLEQVLVLGVIVVIRTVLSMSLQVELEGRWPWQPKPRDQAGRAAE